MAVVSGAAAIPLQVHLPIKSSFLKLSWRQLCMIPFLWGSAIAQLYITKERINYKVIMRKDMVQRILVAAVIGNCMSLCGVFSGTYTIMTHSFVFTNLGGSLIVIYSLISGIPVHK